jgi:hypothetical protein
MTFKEGVATASALPPTGNTQGDARIANDTGHLYIWDGSTWVDQGDIIDAPPGPQGLPGEDGKTPNLVGNWSSGSQYLYFDAVRWTAIYGGGEGTPTGLWLAIVPLPTLGAEPGEIAGEWSLIASDGWQGVEGPQGPPGSGGATIVQDDTVSLDPDETKLITHASDPLYKRFVELLMQLQIWFTIFFNVGTEPNFDYDPDKIVFNEIGIDGFSLAPSYGAEGMIAYYLFNNNVTDSFDSHDGTNHGVTFSAGIVENRADFNGASYIDVPNSSDFIPGTPDDMFAVEFWIKNNPPDGEVISLWNEADNRRSWRLYIDSNKLKMDISEDGITVAGTWELTNTLNTYYNDMHIGLMRNTNDEIKTFINGNKRLPHSYPGAGAAYNNTIDPLRIGAKGGATPTNFFTGWIAELAIYKGFDFDQYAGMYSNYFQSNMGKNMIGQHLSMYDNVMQSIKTNSFGQIDTSSWLGIKSMSFNGDYYGNFQVTVLFSVDGRTTWKAWNGSSWDAVTESTPGCSVESLPSSKADWDLLFVAGTLDYLIQLQSNDPTATPTIYSINMNSVQVGYMDAVGTIKFRFLSDTETEIRNGTGDGGSPETIYDIKTNIIL